MTTGGNSLRKKLVEIPSDKAGAVASNRFDFQKNWAICKLLELHASGDSFVLCFEQHDDIIVLDSRDNPTKVSFYQVKTNSKGNFTLKKLITPKKADARNPKSIFSKLYKHKADFGDDTASLNIVSNSAFEIKLSNASESSEGKRLICFSDVHPDEITKIKDVLAKELSIDKAQITFEDISYLHVSDLPVDQHDSVTRDRLNAYIESMSPGGRFTPSLPYKQLFEEVRRKSRCELSISNYEELLALKSISKDEFDKILDLFVSSDEFEKTRGEIVSRLNSENVDIGFISKFNANWKVFSVARMGASNEVLNHIVTSLKSLMDKAPKSLPSKLFERMQILVGLGKSDLMSQRVYDEDFVQAVALWVIYEKTR